MAFNDDDEIKNIVTEEVSANDNSETIEEGKTQVTVTNCPEAPLEATSFKVMVELTGSGSGKDRPGLDLVTVLDVSGSMGTEKLEKVKKAMEFVINKLSPIDRLSVVKFSDNATRICRLRQITPESKTEIKQQVKDLASNGNTNIAEGLETALAVLAARRLTTGRTVAIMLMSDGAENVRKAAEVEFNNVPVFTFGFGANHDPKVLTAIALKSKGGTFSDVQNEDNLSYAFAQCLAGLLTVLVETLELTLKPIKSTFDKVCAGNYKQVPNNGGSVTISFGNLYIKEVRKVMVELRLPAVTSRLSADILEIAYKYKSLEESDPFDAAPIFVRVRRNGNAVVSNPSPLTCEESRITTCKMMKDARILADEGRMDKARKKLADAQDKLDDVPIDDDDESSKNTIEMIKYEVSELMETMRSNDDYVKQGRAFALSSETSHERQRYAARGDVGYLRLFSTPRMCKYVKQVEAFEEDPTKPVPSEKEDVKEELAADPLASIAGALSYYIQNAIQSLQAIDKILKKPLNA